MEKPGCRESAAPRGQSERSPALKLARCRTPRATDPSGGAKARPAAPANRRCLPLLLGLAPGGVYPAATVAGGAVRSYRTISPLPPARPRAGRIGGVFLWHFP